MSCYIDQVSRSSLLPDEVWAQLSPEDARLTRMSRRRLALLVVVIVVLATGAALLQVSGLLTPQVEMRTGSASAGGHAFMQSVQIENTGWFDEHLSAVDSHARGAEVVSVKGAGSVIHPGASITIEVDYRMLDCSAVRASDPAPINLRLHRSWGTRTVTVQSGGDSAGLSWVACGHGPR
jgi:hypothetical protein